MRYFADRRELLKNDIATFVARQKAELEAMDKLTGYVANDPSQVLIDPNVNDGDVWTELATLFTRISVLLILVFLVQILVGLYRYSLRLAAFYDSRGDALVLHGANEISMGKWSDTLSPADIDFGKAPVSPSQHLENLFSKWTEGKKAG
ncbi:hypothetical protein [Thalassobium sp. R2A62]|uniref:hypothetical protein n=1 Tax=Thalassobium sp. R2A62 TaxID=633131 RepID=UPI0012319B75|nr:hypothetical protein [Thalassobium sp. R2A62]MDG1339059.1 hypothetical protein [Paracoccaceae bacterium]